MDKVISLLPSTGDYQKFGRKSKLLIHPDNIPDTNISLPSRKQTKMISEESEIGENYQISREKSKTSNMEMFENNREQTKIIGEESEISKNYKDSHEKSKTSGLEMLNSIDCSAKTLNDVNVSLISAPCPVTKEATRDENTEVQQTEELVWDKLKSLLSNKSVVKRNENSGFSFFL